MDCFLLEEDKDRISELDDDVLGLILSRLGLKEVARTTVLSRRWISALNLFSGPLIFDFTLLQPMPHHLTSSPAPVIILDGQRRFIRLVNQVLTSITRPSFEDIRIRLLLGSDWASDLDNWFIFAFRTGVRALEVDCRPLPRFGTRHWDDFPSFQKEMYSFPLALFSHTTSASLKCLRLNCVEVSEEALRWILTHCPNLWSLSIGGMNKLVSLKVSVPSLKLTHLELNCRHCRNMTDLEISAGPLLSLLIMAHNQDIRFSLQNTSRLVEAGFSTKLGAHLIDRSARFSSVLSNLETLKLNVLEQGWDYTVLQLNNLKHLELFIFTSSSFPSTLQLWCTFLKGAPFVQRLIVTIKVPSFSYLEPPRELEKVIEKNPHRALKEVTISGYIDCPRVHEFIIYLVENNLSLEKIVVDAHREPDEPIIYGIGDYQTIREKALQFKSQLPTHINYIVV